MWHAPRPRPEQTAREQVQTVIGNLVRVVPLVWRLAPWRMLAAVILHVAQAALPAAQVYLTRSLVNAAAAAIAGGPAHLGPAYRLLALQAGLALAGACLGALRRFNMAHLERLTSLHVDGLVAAKAARLPLTFFDQSDFYDRLQRAQAGVGQRALNMVTQTLQGGQSILTVAAYLAILAHFDWWLAVILVGLAGMSLAVYSRAGNWRFWQMRRQTPSARRALYLLSLLWGREAAKELRMFGLQQHLTSRWHDLVWQNAREQVAVERKAAVGRLLTDGAGGVAGAGATAFLLWLGAAGRLTLGDYVALAQALLSAQAQMAEVAFVLSRIYEDALFATDLFAFLTLPEEPQPADPLPFPAPLRQGIAVDGLSFAYPGSARPVLQEISFTIRPGEKVAIVGENGAGKTTLIKCLLGLYQPTAGTIRYDGVEIRRLDPASLHRHVTAIFQDFVRYQLTMRENIGFGRVEQMADDAALAAAAARGGAAEVAATLPQAYDTELGPTFAQGQELSYGQWQKIALSRAFFRDAEVIALDEPTAALDPKAEAAVFTQFARLAAGKTALLISHRLGTCRSADRILVLKDGRLAEQGSHEELMRLGGEYARMFQVQAGWYA